MALALSLAEQLENHRRERQGEETGKEYQRTLWAVIRRICSRGVNCFTPFNRWENHHLYIPWDAQPSQLAKLERPLVGGGTIHVRSGCMKRGNEQTLTE